MNDNGKLIYSLDSKIIIERKIDFRQTRKYGIHRINSKCMLKFVNPIDKRDRKNEKNY